MRAITDEAFKEIFPHDVIYSDKTNKQIIDSMADQIIENNYRKTTEKNISLIMDGGTVMHTKWLAIGYNYETSQGNKFQILDCVVFEKATSANIKILINSISQKVSNQFHGQVASICTDNASNFVSVFIDDDENDSDFIPLNIIRLSCACHTAQLVLRDLYDNDEEYKYLTDIIKSIPTRLTKLKRSDLDNMGISSFPPMQSQRWNSIFISLNYIMQNIANISCDF